MIRFTFSEKPHCLSFCSSDTQFTPIFGITFPPNLYYIACGLLDFLTFGRIQMMAWFINLIRSFFGLHPQHLRRRNLMGMYFLETNKGGRRKSNRERY